MEDDLKRYYTISEVAEMFKVSKSLIRFWETEFENLKPAKNAKGDRRFTKQNIGQLQLIYHLVRERGFTLNGAKIEMEVLKKRKKEKNKIVEPIDQLASIFGKIKRQFISFREISSCQLPS